MDRVLGYRRVEKLLRDVVSTIRENGAQAVGFDLDINSSASSTRCSSIYALTGRWSTYTAWSCS